MQEEVYIYLKFVETNLIPEEITNILPPLKEVLN